MEPNKDFNKVFELIQKIGSDVEKLCGFPSYITNYGEEIGLPYLKFDNDGFSSLTFNGKINVLIKYNKDKNQCLFSAPIGPIPTENSNEFFKKILISNAFGIENGGAVLGIERETYRLIISYIFVASCFSYTLFRTVLLNFVNVVDDWQTKYDNLIGSYYKEKPKMKFKNLYIKRREFSFNFDFSKFISESKIENADISHYISKYGKEIGLPNLSFKNNNVCSLKFDDKLDVDIVYNKENNQCIFASPIGYIPDYPSEVYFKHLLSSNAFGTETGGAMLGIEVENNRIVLAYNFISNICSYELFRTALKNFVNLAEEWQIKHKYLCEARFSFQSDLSKYISF